MDVYTRVRGGMRGRQLKRTAALRTLFRAPPDVQDVILSLLGKMRGMEPVRVRGSLRGFRAKGNYRYKRRRS